MTLAAWTGKPIAILLLEDDPLDAELCQRKLEGANLPFTITNVGNAGDFKSEVAARPFDVILGDYQLPNWTGLDAVRWLRSSGHSVPFILVTGALGDELAVECMKEGVTDYILKDKMERLPFALRRAVEEGRMRAERDQREQVLRESEHNLSQSKYDLGQSEHDLGQSEYNLSQSARDLSRSEYKLTQSENNLSHSEIELHRSERQFASIIRGAPYGIFRSDDKGRILMANPALIKMLGYGSEAEVLKLNLEEDVYVDAGERREILGKLNDENKFSRAEVKWRHKSGKIITVKLDGWRLEIKAGETAIYKAFAQDITEQKLMEQQFHQAQKMEAIGRLAGGVAHDFNNLLMIIRGCAELLDYHKGDPQKIRGYIKQINDATSIAASVVQQLMAFSRKQAPEKSALDFNAVLRDLRKMLPRLLGEDIQISFAPGQTLARVCADRAQFEQIILNLAVNARDAMPTGGKLAFATSNVILAAPQFESGGIELPRGSYVLLSVTDNGTGMDQEIQSHIFEPFFTTKERGKGTGLGLATVYGIVKENHGFITVDSTPGKGTAFKIYFPVDVEAKEVVVPVQIAPPPGGTETILLVEDEAALREITCEYLESRGYSVLCASTGLHALEFCRNYESPIDILMTDIIMPGIQGPELVKAALKMRPGMRVIYVSGYTDRGLEIVVSENAVLLHKPYSLADLGHTIRTTASAPTA
jgi:two-component system, cell cycle sensor histidine kinase and response regulator CckA